MRVPLWFDEGYAGWAAGEWDRLGVAGAQSGRGARSAARISARSTARCGAPRPRADAAYALAVSAVAELARRNPTGTSAPLLERLDAGEDFEAAVLATTGLTVDRFEEAWQRTVRRRYGLVHLAPGGRAGGSLVAAAVLGLVHFRRRADRDRAGRRSMRAGWWSPEAVDGPELDPTR